MVRKPASSDRRQVAIILVVFGVFVVASILGGLLVAKSFRADPPSEPAVSQDARLLVDDTAKAKGKTFRFSLYRPSADDKTLRDRLGEEVRFRGIFNGASVDVMILVPATLNVPNAASSDHLDVTFVCGSGSLTSGNVATEIRRP